jgi:hypothetical protein
LGASPGTGVGRITILGVLKTYGTYDVPNRMVATIRTEDNSWSQEVFIDGQIIKAGDNNRSDSRRRNGTAYLLPTVEVPKSGTYVVNVGVRVAGWKVI